MLLNSYVQLIDETIAFLKERIPKKGGKPKLTPLPPPPPKPKVTPPPVLEPVKIEEKKEPFLELHPPKQATFGNAERMKSLLKTLAPNLYLHETPLPDEQAKRIKNAWQEKSLVPEIPIFCQGDAFRTFLNNLAKAISLSFAPSRVIDISSLEKEKKWDIFFESPQLRFILCPDHLLFSSKELLSFYLENPGQKSRFLGKIPLLLLPDLSLYFKDPYLKRSLWNVICQALQ